jgi:hypothetical protein
MLAGISMASWIVYPIRATSIETVVPAQYLEDYQEAESLLDISPRMSAVMTRRLLSDVLAEHAGIKHSRLTQQVKEFVEDPHHPASIRESLHYLRELGDFGAHTQKSDEEEIIDVTRQQAQWALSVLRRLFEYLIVEPAEDRQMRDELDEAGREAGRTPIPPLVDGPQADE